MSFKLTPRLGYGAGLVICVLLFAFALYLQHFEYQTPCPLCILQRIVYLALMVVFLVGAIHGPRRIGAYCYSAALVVIDAIGIAIASRHVWLQHLPKDRVPECGPGLEYLVNRFPLTQALEKVFRGSGECAEVGWTFLTLSIAEWSLVWFVLLGALAIWVAIAARGLR